MQRYGWLITLIGVLLIVIFGRSLVWISPAREEMERLLFENAKLQAELAEFRMAPSLEREGAYTYLEARVYAAYPLNNRNSITINAGSLLGVEVGAPVVLGRAILVGEVSDVRPHSAVVRTIFDSGWSSAVKIGERAVDGLLKGGVLPRVTMIEKGGALREGDAVFSASASYPYGLRVGAIRRIREISEQAFSEADLVATKNVRDLDAVEVILDFDARP